MSNMENTVFHEIDEQGYSWKVYTVHSGNILVENEKSTELIYLVLDIPGCFLRVEANHPHTWLGYANMRNYHALGELEEGIPSAVRVHDNNDRISIKRRGADCIIAFYKEDVACAKFTIDMSHAKNGSAIGAFFRTWIQLVEDIM